MRRLVLAALFAVFVSTPAAAAPGDGNSQGPGGGGGGGGGKGGISSVPEFDPATVGAIGAVIAGGGVLIARRRKR